MRRAARIDANQPAVVNHLRAIGWRVFIASGFGGGFPDLVVSRDGWSCVVEIKDGSKPPSERRLTPDEEAFRKTWDGPYVLAISPEDAAAQLEAAREKKR